MGIVLLLLMLAGAVGAAALMVRTMRARALAERRRAALDARVERVCLQALLPADATSSNHKMTRFWARLCDLLPDDAQRMADGSDVVSCALVAQGRSAGQAALVRLLVWCPADLAALVETTLQDAYEGELQVNHLDDDPLSAWAEQELAARPAAAVAGASGGEEQPAGVSASLRSMRGLLGDDED